MPIIGCGIGIGTNKNIKKPQPSLPSSDLCLGTRDWYDTGLPLIKVYQSFGGLSEDFSADSSGILDINAVLAFVGEDDIGEVELYDQSGNGKNFVNPDSSTRPSICEFGEVNLIDGIPAIKFTNSTLTPSIELNFSSEHFLVVKVKILEIVNEPFVGIASDGTVMLLQRASPFSEWGTWGGYTGVSQVTSTTLSLNTSYVLGMKGFNFSGGSFYTNGIFDGYYQSSEGQDEGHIGGISAQKGRFYLTDLVRFSDSTIDQQQVFNSLE